jgi:hypothetical protein
MTLNKKPVAKKRGRPPSSKNKTSAAKVRAWDNKNISSKRTFHVYYDALLVELKKVNCLKVEDLKHKEIGYRAVISYLQARLDGNAEL